MENQWKESFGMASKNALTSTLHAPPLQALLDVYI